MERHGVAFIDQIAPGQANVVLVQGVEIGVFWSGGEYRAYRNLCPHAGAPICSGGVAGTVLRCPWHGWQFDLRTGEYLGNPAIRLQAYRVEVEGNRLFVWA